MLFSEELFQEAQIFEEYYEEGAYYRLPQAYLAYVSREYVVEERKIGRSVIDIICRNMKKERQPSTSASWQSSNTIPQENTARRPGRH